MSSDVLQFVVGPGLTAVAGAGRIFNLLSAPAGPVSIAADRRSQAGGQSLNRNFNGIPAGSKFVAKVGEEWTYLRITSAFSQVITLYVGDDDMQFNNAVTVTGTASTVVQPSGVITDAPAVALPNAATTQIVPANPARRRVTIGNPSTALASFFIRSATGANNLIEIQPGTFTEFDTTARLDGRNDSGAALSATVFEET